MKELSIEEKAKRYDEAYKVAKNIHIFSSDLAEIKRMEEIFPELKEESEDERIRKKICKLLWDNAPYEEAQEYITWLEKQCEKKSINNLTQQEAMDIAVAKCFEQGEQKATIEMKTPEESLGIDSNTYNKIVDECIYGEQKHTDKVEPKFHKGDLVVYCNEDVDLITGIEENGYCINNSGYIPFVCASDVRLWTIQDAKDGDVLVSESTCGLGTWYCIFKSLDGDESMTVYCYLARDGRFETKKELCFDKDPYNTNPATKEQRDLLFQKMHDAGYEWDAEKKELKKIEQKLAWSKEDETTKNNISHIIRQYDKISKRENQPCWYVGDCLLWLSSLKDRVQPKQEWSGGDEAHLHSLITHLEQWIERHPNTTGADIQGENVAWLKSLKLKLKD